MSFDKLINNMYNSDCKGNVMLEPRLTQYLEKKRFQRDNNIEPCIKPEVEFQITPEDLRLMKQFRNSGKDIYNFKTNSNPNFSTRFDCPKPTFPSKFFKDDKRVPAIEKIQNQRKFSISENMFMFKPDSDEDFTIKQNPRSLNPTYESRGFSLNDNKFQPRIDPQMDYGKETFNPRDSQYYIPKESQTHCVDPDPRNKFANKSNSSLNKLFELERNLDSNSNYVPKNRKRLNTSDYTFKRFDQSVNVSVNSELESDLLRGMPTYRPRNKSYGYRNPGENYFDYIDCNFQNSQNTVESWLRGGESTRLDNKFQTRNRNYTREVL